LKRSLKALFPYQSNLIMPYRVTLKFLLKISFAK
jgi:hypothetical protein